MKENSNFISKISVIGISVIFGAAAGFGAAYFTQLPPTRSVAAKLTSTANADITTMVKRVSPSVVSITGQGTTRGFFGLDSQEVAGTGIIISADGYILTNDHVLPAGFNQFTVTTSDGHTYNDARIVKQDSVHDLALLKVKATSLSPAAIGDSGGVQVGQTVVAIGYALGEYQNSVTQGIISGLSRNVTAGSGRDAEQLSNVFQTDTAINSGNSGGPLINPAGQVIGINTAVSGNAQNIGFAIPINQAKTLIAASGVKI